MESVFYFAYSHHMDASVLRSLEIPIYSSCAGMVQGYRLEFNVLEDELYRFESRGMANIMPCCGGIVEGILFEIDASAVPVLDRDAGVSLLKYYRKTVPVITQNGDNFQAVSYAAWPDMTSKGLYPSEKYLDLILTAARQPGISNQYRSWLESHATVV